MWGQFIVIGLVSVQTVASQAAPVTYEQFCSKPVLEKRQVFGRLAPSDKTLIAQTQLERWRDQNRPKLSEAQGAAIKDWLAVLPASFGAVDKPSDLGQRLKALEDRIGGLFSKDEQRAMDQFGPCISKLPK